MKWKRKSKFITENVTCIWCRSVGLVKDEFFLSSCPKTRKKSKGEEVIKRYTRKYQPICSTWLHRGKLMCKECRTKTKQQAETVIDVTSCRCVYFCVSEGKSSSGASTTLHSPAEVRPVCPSSSLGPWWDGGDGGCRGTKLLPLGPRTSAARFARCSHPRGSVQLRIAFVGYVGMWKPQNLNKLER